MMIFILMIKVCLLKFYQTVIFLRDNSFNHFMELFNFTLIS